MIPPEFIIIPYQLIEDENLGPLDERVYGVIYWLTRLRGEKCTASNPTLAEVCRTTAKSVQNSLRNLEKNGYIKRINKEDGSNHRMQIIPMVVFNKLPSTGGRLPPVDGRGLPSTGGQNKSNINNSIKEYTPLTPQGGIKDLIGGSEATKDRSEGREVNDMIALFERVNPSYEQLFKKKNQRDAMARLLKKHGRERMEGAIAIMIETSSAKYAPVITTPVELENKLGQLLLFAKKSEGGGALILN